MIPMVIGVLGTVLKGLERGPRNWKSEEESRPSLLRSARILRRVLET